MSAILSIYLHTLSLVALAATGEAPEASHVAPLRARVRGWHRGSAPIGSSAHVLRIWLVPAEESGTIARDAACLDCANPPGPRGRDPERWPASASAWRHHFCQRPVLGPAGGQVEVPTPR